MKVVIIAAGCGSRLEKMHKGMPKTLIEINGKRLIDDIISKIRVCGINAIIIITGYKRKMLVSALNDYKKDELQITFVYNPNWKKANGISVLCAKDYISEDEQFILLMSDHIFEKEILNQTVKTKIGKDEALLALDFKISKIPDLDDGMKIQCTKTDETIYSIQKFGKKLNSYNAIDCGIFKFNYNFFSILEESIKNNKCSLSDACNILAQKNKIKGLDIKDNLWLDVDTPEILNSHDVISKII